MSINQKENVEQKRHSWREVLYEVIFKADTIAGKAFDITLIVIILRPELYMR